MIPPLPRARAVRALNGVLALLLALLTVTLLVWRSPRPLGGLSALRPEDVTVAAVGVLAVRWALAAPRLPEIHAARLVTLGVALYAALLSFVTIGRHRTFQTHALDLGQYAQNIWHLAHGIEPIDTVLGWHVWGNHFSPIFYLLLPAPLLVRGPTYLLVLQSVALALGAVPLYLLARRRVGGRLAAAIAVLYLLNPSLHGVNLRDFHPTALAIPLLLVAMWAFEAGRPLLFGLATVLTLATREDAAIAVVGLGLWLALAHRRWLLGGAVALVSIAWLFLAVDWLMPRFRDDGVYPYVAAHYRHLGNSLGELLLAPLRRPLTVLTTLLTPDRARYLGAILGPLAFLPLLGPSHAVAALPGLAQNLLSDYPILFNYRSQYQSFVLPFLFVGIVVGVQRLRDTNRRGRLAWLSPRAALLAATLGSLVLSARTVNSLAVDSWRLSPMHQAAHRMLARIPDGASVSAAERFFPHLYERTQVFVFPREAERSDWILVDDSTLRRSPAGSAAAIASLPRDAEAGGLRLLRRPRE